MGKRVSYSQSIISYLDVLGFRDLINCKTPGQISRIVRLLKERTKQDKEVSRAHGMKFFAFSDTIIRINPTAAPQHPKFKAGHLFLEILDLVHAQCDLILQKIVVRGAVSIGDIVKSWGVLYGPGIVRAYELEQEASFPRIIIDPQAFRLLRTNPAWWLHDYEEERSGIMSLLRKDKDGHLFIDYLRSVESEMDFPEKDYPQFIRSHADLIAEGLVRHRLNRKVIQKFKWMQKYHNSTVISRFGSNKRKDLLV